VGQLIIDEGTHQKYWNVGWLGAKLSVEGGICCKMSTWQYGRTMDKTGGGVGSMYGGESRSK